MARTVRYNELFEWDDDKEEKISYLLSEQNVRQLKNLIYYERQRKENLTLDPAKPFEFIQAEAEVRGALGAYQFLLDKHNELITGIAVDPGYPNAPIV